MTLQSIASKYRRALRNRTGATFTLDQLQELADHGVLALIVKMEAEELCPATRHPSSSEITGSTSVETGSRRTSGKSQPTPASRGPLSIAALSEGL